MRMRLVATALSLAISACASAPTARWPGINPACRMKAERYTVATGLSSLKA